MSNSVSVEARDNRAKVFPCWSETANMQTPWLATCLLHSSFCLLASCLLARYSRLVGLAYGVRYTMPHSALYHSSLHGHCVLGWGLVRHGSEGAVWAGRHRGYTGWHVPGGGSGGGVAHTEEPRFGKTRAGLDPGETPQRWSAPLEHTCPSTTRREHAHLERAHAESTHPSTAQPECTHVLPTPSPPTDMLPTRTTLRRR